MPATSVQHGDFTIERVLDAPVSLVFAAWSDKTAKAKWFGAHADGKSKSMKWTFASAAKKD